MNNEDLPDSSDSSDEDYVPDDFKSGDVPSEVDSDGDPEEPLSDSERTSKKGAKRTKKGRKPRKKQKKEPTPEPELEEKQTDLTEEEQKKKDDDLWADFMKDTGFKSKSFNPQTSSQEETKPTATTAKPPSQSKVEEKKTETVKITKIFEFAGEEVKVEQEVAVNSAEARLLNNKPSSTTSTTAKRVRPGGSLSGISSVLSQLGKKQKISTLEKSKLDWDQYKKEENIDEEIKTYNKGKNGYLDRQDFLQRADLRRFEIEKEVRTIERNKRLNNTL